MLYAFFSDIHANIFAWQKVKAKLKKIKPDKLVFLGDAVGYGANPRECWQELKSLKLEAVCGNHDWAVAGKKSLDDFSPFAYEVLVWTKENLSLAAKAELGNLPLVWQDDYCLGVHGDLSRPDEFLYLDNLLLAEENFSLLDVEKICFLAHTHIPAVFSLRPKKIEYRRGVGRIKLGKKLKHIVNVGSVGQPRDRDWRAGFCFYDSEKREVEFIRLEYNAKAAQDGIKRAGLPELLALRLGQGW